MPRFNMLILVLSITSGVCTGADAGGIAKTAGLDSGEAFRRSANSLDAMPAEERRERLDLLGSAIIENPVTFSDDLEASIGGRMALRAYVQAMVQDGRLSDLAEQLFAVMHAAEPAESFVQALNRSERQDGSVWYPHAEQAGFFAGGIAAVLDGKSADRGERSAIGFMFGKDRHQDAKLAIAQRFGLDPPGKQEPAADWMLRAFTGSKTAVLRSAAQWFEKGFAKAYR